MSKGARRKRIEAERKLAAQKEARRTFCGGEKRNGKPCKREAGWGTSHPGTGRCKMHGGASPNGAMAAAHQETLGMARPIEVTPGSALAGVLNLAAGQLAYVTWKVAALQEKEIISDVGVHPWVRLQRNMMMDVAKMAKLASDAGIDERMASLAEQQTAMMAKLVEAVLGELDLTPEQKLLAGPALRKHVAVLEGKVIEAPEKVAV